MKHPDQTSSAGVITHGMDAPETFAVGDVVSVCGGRCRYGIVDRISVAPGKLATVVRWGTIRQPNQPVARRMKRIPLVGDEHRREFVYDPKGRTSVFKLRPDGRWLERKDDAGCGLIPIWHREGRFHDRPHRSYRPECRAH